MHLNVKNYFFAMILVFSLFLEGSQAGALSDEEEVLAWPDKLSKSYQVSNGISMKIKKVVYLSIMDETKKYHGQLFIKQKNILIKLEKDGGAGEEKTSTLIKNNKIWITEWPNKNSTNKPRVVIANISKVGGKKKAEISNAILALLGGKSIDRYFKTVKVVEGDGKKMTVVSISPKKTSNEITQARLKISKKGIIKELSYWDSLENKTTYAVEEVDFKTLISSKKFKFLAPKNAEITHF